MEGEGGRGFFRTFRMIFLILFFAGTEKFLFFLVFLLTF